MPSNPHPVNNASDQPTTLTLQWDLSTDPDNDPITYDVYFGTDTTTATKVSPDQRATSLIRSGLVHSRVYYWKVVAKDDHNHSTPSAFWEFATIPPPNGSPSAPSNPRPTIYVLIESTDVTLDWDPCTDPENDPITYDVYFGTSADPPM